MVDVNSNKLEMVSDLELDIVELDARLEMLSPLVIADWWIGGGSGSPPAAA